MKRFLSICLIFLASIAINSNSFAQSTRSSSANNQTKQRQSDILTNESIISLVRADFKEKTILALIRSSVVNFDLSAQKLILLKKNGVNENVIQTMIERQNASNNAASLRDDDFFNADDEAFFKNSPKLSLPELSRKNADGNSANNSTKETDIFGSRSGSKSGSRTRGGNTERDNNSEVTGSATVRIIKPPSEGGNEPKLERAHKLTNQEIIDMVQAGFSEGTILRKIEITQVEFDISSKAQETLRKNRVSEKVLQAMRDAMNESK